MPLLETFANASARGFETFGPAGGPTPAYELLSTTTLGSTTATVTLDVSGAASSYKHLQVRATIRTSTTSNNLNPMYVRLNSNDSGYSSRAMFGNGSGVSTLGLTAQAQGIMGYCPDSYVANNYGTFIFDLLDFASTSKTKTTRTFSGSIDPSMHRRVTFGSNGWESTAAVTSINFFSNASYGSGSRFSIYGIKG